MPYDKPLRMLKESHPRTIRKRQTSTRCFSKSRETADVKTSIHHPEPISFFKMVERLNYKIAAGISNHSFKDSEECCIKMNKTVLLRDPFYTSILYLNLVHLDIDKLIFFRPHFDDAFDLIMHSPNEYGDCLSNCIIQEILHLECLMQNIKKLDSKDNIYIALNFLVFEVIDNHEPDPPEPDPPAVISPFIEAGSLSDESALTFMVKFFFGVDLSEPDGERIELDWPKEALIAWLIFCYFIGALDIPDKFVKKHRNIKDKNVPNFCSLIKNYFTITTSPEGLDTSTVQRNIDTIYNYLLAIRKTKNSHIKMSQKRGLKDLIEQYNPCDEPLDGIKKMKRWFYNNIKLACEYIPE